MISIVLLLATARSNRSNCRRTEHMCLVLKTEQGVYLEALSFIQWPILLTNLMYVFMLKIHF